MYNWTLTYYAIGLAIGLVLLVIDPWTGWLHWEN